MDFRDQMHVSEVVLAIVSRMRTQLTHVIIVYNSKWVYRQRW